MKKSHVVVYSALLLLLGSVCSQAQQSLTSTRNGNSNAGSQALSNVSGTGTQRTPPQCSGQVSRLPGSIAGPCKPVLAGTQTQELSNDLPGHDDGAVYVEFVVPGSTCEASFPRCTTPVAINLFGAVTGYYADTNASLHGFLRTPLGTITTFDGPDATCSGYFSICTSPVGINLQGSITGFYCDAVTCHGFLRPPGGTIIAFDPPESVFTQFDTGGINLAGVITGSYYDANFLEHGFLRAPRGTFTSFDAPGAVNGTSPTGINDAGEVVGFCYDANFVVHGFLRAPDGTMTTFDPTGSIYTSANAINLEGATTGWWQDASDAIHGFLRSRDGTLTTFDVPGSMGQTEPGAIDPAGTITGSFQDASGALHGFVRANDGTFTTFDPPGSAEPSSLTIADGINPSGVITGWYIDPSFIGHGFLRIPGPVIRRVL
jgi:probable HAF family extracellular repeat protein